MLAVAQDAVNPIRALRGRSLLDEHPDAVLPGALDHGGEVNRGQHLLGDRIGGRPLGRVVPIAGRTPVEPDSWHARRRAAMQGVPAVAHIDQFGSVRHQVVLDPDAGGRAETFDEGRAGLLLPGHHAGSWSADRRQVHGPLAGDHGPDLLRIGRKDVAGPPLARDAMAGPEPAHGAQFAAQVVREQPAGARVGGHGGHVVPDSERYQGRRFPG